MAEQLGAKQPLGWVDLIRVVAIFQVIVIHAGAALMYEWGRLPLSAWMAANIHDALAHVSVPLLFMISGYLLLSKTESIREFFYKRAVRILIPAIFWSLFYLFWTCSNSAGLCKNKEILRMVLQTGTYYHLWFLYTLIGLYLAVPILRRVVASGGSAVLWYFIALWLVFEPGLDLIKTVWNVQIGITAPVFTGFLGYFVLGYLLGGLQLSRQKIFVALLVWLAASAVTIVGTYIATQQDGSLNGYFYGYLTFNIILAAASLFLLIKQVAPTVLGIHPALYKWIKLAARASFGIYLVHAFVLDFIGGRIPYIRINTSLGHPIWSIPLVSIIAFLASFAAVYLLQKIPLIRRTVS